MKKGMSIMGLYAVMDAEHFFEGLIRHQDPLSTYAKAWRKEIPLVLGCVQLTGNVPNNVNTAAIRNVSKQVCANIKSWFDVVMIFASL